MTSLALRQTRCDLKGKNSSDADYFPLDNTPFNKIGKERVLTGLLPLQVYALLERIPSLLHHIFSSLPLHTVKTGSNGYTFLCAFHYFKHHKYGCYLKHHICTIRMRIFPRCYLQKLQQSKSLLNDSIEWLKLS